MGVNEGRRDGEWTKRKERMGNVMLMNIIL
jgi:hypothetical protein